MNSATDCLKGVDTFRLHAHHFAHAEGDRVVLDGVRETYPPFSPDAVVAEYARVSKTYGFTMVVADRYAGQ